MRAGSRLRARSAFSTRLRSSRSRSSRSYCAASKPTLRIFRRWPTITAARATQKTRKMMPVLTFMSLRSWREASGVSCCRLPPAVCRLLPPVFLASVLVRAFVLRLLSPCEGPQLGAAGAWVCGALRLIGGYQLRLEDSPESGALPIAEGVLDDAVFERMKADHGDDAVLRHAVGHGSQGALALAA